MKKHLIFYAMCLVCMSAMAQEPSFEMVDAVKFEQNSVVEWYKLATKPTVTIGTSTITIAGKTYDLSEGAVVTTFGKAPEIPSNVEGVNAEQRVTKIFRDGQVLIIRDGQTYNVLGAKVD